MIKRIVIIVVSIAVIVVARFVLEDLAGITTTYAVVISTVVGLSVYATLTDTDKQKRIDDLERELEEMKGKMKE